MNKSIAVKWIKRVVIIFLLAGSGFFLYQKYKPAPEAPVEAPAPITFQVTQETITQEIQVKGKSAYTDQTDVFAPFTGPIKQWHVENGQAVRKGAALFSLDSKTLQNEVQQMESEMMKSRLENKLNKISAKQGEGAEQPGVTEEERKKAFADRESKRLMSDINEEAIAVKEQDIAFKKSLIGMSTVSAPASGVFLLNETDTKTRMVNEGQYVGTVVNTGKLQFTAAVSEQEIFRIKAGMPVKVQMTGKKEIPLTGKVSRISKFAKKGAENDPKQVSQFDIVIDLKPDPSLIGGISLEGKIETARKEKAIVVPSLAVMREQNEAYVMLDKGNGNYERQTIQTGIETDDKTEVLNGLKPGDTVVLP
ncbi:efflux RND transporter periplasmic adaptor subunit [Paenibacillus oralis]|uniref:Efflux RND transporter periplasmic adaptor subunit n=1 Tax=Paenibacillus oralis TaxID=2490856 RepID=A0A3P3TVE6_9BACL|nr:efflux RND transporter periplasmic adaptor subunit [Paenibacillus oralis]RRJ61810.1 efflux RND transporter periplasmic adaptor subunit [Paenibacillus oralis]